MFGNFIFFIVALILYTTYQPLETPRFPPGTTFFLFALLTFGYLVSVRQYFGKITTALRAGVPHHDLVHRFDTGIRRYSILALIVFAIDLYGLDLVEYLNPFHLFQILPTLEALLFLALFIAYLAIVWYEAYPPQRGLFGGPMTRRAYIIGQISFNLPILLPWLALSTCMDLIGLMPFEAPKRLLSTAWGQAIFFLGFLFLAAVVAPAIIRIFWRCHPLPDSPDRRRIEALSRRAGVKFAAILQWPLFGGRMLTAGVMGLVSRFRYLLVTDALIQLLTPDEVDSVIAHELGHVKKKHLLYYLFFLGGYMLISFSILDLIIYFIVYSQPVTVIMETIGQDRAGTTAIFSTLVTIALFVLYFRYIFGFFMRNFERQADTYVYTLFTSALPLISTLKKIAFTSGQTADRPNWHHFSISERIAYLEKCETDRRWIRRQDRKIKKGITIFTAAMVMVGGIGYQTNFGKLGQRLNDRFYESVLKKEIARNPDHPDLYRALGDIYYHKKKYSQAIDYYIQTLDMSPDDAEALNNLAWLYATCEDESFRSPGLALNLSKKAASISPKAHIMDTLAESYYINGQLEMAVQSARSALEAARENRSYFSGQLKKFREAVARKNGL
ncbi:MAG: peptidase [Deltaproteobacteria bacterium]|nr:MAG: peptidase [Deltaproteobacteria bacterium]